MPVMIVGPSACFAAGSVLLGAIVGVAGFAVWCWGLVGVVSMGRLVQRDLIAAGHPVRGAAPLQNAWSLRAWADRNRLSAGDVVEAAERASR